MSMSFCTTSSLNLRPMRRFTANSVFFGIGDGLALGRLAHHHFAVLGERDDRRRGAITLAVLDHARLAAFHDGDAGIGRSQVDADDFCHVVYPKKNVPVRADGPYLGADGFRFKCLQAARRATMTRAGRSNRPLSS